MIERTDNRLKTFMIIAAAAAMIFLAFPMPVSADAGPKASITVRVENLPEGEVYLDLLIEQPPIEDGEYGYRYGEYEWGVDPDYYDQKMLSILKAYNVGGWRPMLVTGSTLPMWGELRLNTRDGSAVSEFGYMGVPNRFKIIAVSESGEVVVSNVIDKRTFESVVFFDFSTGVAKEQAPMLPWIKRFAIALAVTLIIEGLILLLFRFSLKQNWKPFLLINIFTQIGLHLGIVLTQLALGTFFAFAAYIILEVIILIVEAVLFAKFLKQHSKLRRVMYAITANILSFIAGIFIFVLTSFM